MSGEIEGGDAPVQAQRGGQDEDVLWHFEEFCADRTTGSIDLVTREETCGF